VVEEPDAVMIFTGVVASRLTRTSMSVSLVLRCTRALRSESERRIAGQVSSGEP
jgi:hypothetical protein